MKVQTLSKSDNSFELNEIKSRFREFQQQMNLSDNELSRRIGTAPSSIGDFITKSGCIGKVIQNTIIEFGDLNCNWLFRGHGAMLISNDVRTHTHNNEVQDASSNDLVNYLIEVNSALHERIIQLERENAILSNSANKKS